MRAEVNRLYRLLGRHEAGYRRGRDLPIDMRILRCMVKRARAMDISDAPELLRLVEEVRRAGEPRVLQRDGQDVAVVAPLPEPKRNRERAPSEADYEAFRSAAGSWADVDTDALIENIYETRRRSNRSPVEL